MSKLNFSKGKFARFISSKGFYVALAVCLVGASAATWLAVDRTITGIENNNSQLLEQDTNFTDFPLLEEAETKKEDVPQSKPESAPSTQQPSSSTSSSSAEEQSKPAAASAPSVPQPTSQALAYALPIKGEILREYSAGELVKNTTLGDWRTHDGMDIAANKGDDICAAADGVVSEVKSDPLWGTIVVIDHADGYQTWYYGLNKNVPVKVGENVQIKQAIGKLDSIPCEAADKPHLHFSLKKEAAWCDPREVVGS